MSPAGRIAVLVLAGSLGLAPPAARAGARDPRRVLLEALDQELTRSRERLGVAAEGFAPPYFVAYRLQDTHTFDLGGRYGALFRSSERHNRRFSVEVRIGDYAFDNTGKQEFAFDWEGDRYAPRTDAPLDDSVSALRNALWLATDAQYKQSLAAYHKKKGKRVYAVDDGKEVGSFSHETPVQSVGPRLRFPFERRRWGRLVRRLGEQFRDHPAVFDHQIRVTATHRTRYFVNSEGSRIVEEAVLYAVQLSAVARADDGMLLETDRALYSREYDELPTQKTLRAQVRQMIAELEALRAAPAADPYTGPAILEPEATGVIFHEAIGHRLEGDRQEDEKEGRTFKGQVGKKIIPEFLSVFDDPTLARFGGQTLNGHYAHDDEGVPGQRVVLVDRGVLRSFLLSRKPIEGFAHSNGHGRGAAGSAPMSRQGNLIIEAHAAVPAARLKQQLIALARQQGKPYGLLLKDISGGSTNTSNYGYQVFKGKPRMVYRVWVDDGREELVRGVEMVGTPLSSVNRIVAAGEARGVFNGFCGAESGYIPVSTIAPAVLINEIELQRSERSKERPPLLPSPWQQAPPSAGTPR